MFDSSVKIEMKQSGFRDAFQFVSYVLKTNSARFNIVVIYRPPVSSISAFGNDFIDFALELTSDQSNTLW